MILSLLTVGFLIKMSLIMMGLEKGCETFLNLICLSMRYFLMTTEILERSLTNFHCQ